MSKNTTNLVRYKMVKAPNHPKANKDGYVYEHIIVAEKNIGRHLKSGEVVHHKDRNRTNNSPDNLIVFASNADHTLCHSGAQIYNKDNIWHAIPISVYNICRYCGASYKVANRTEGNKRQYCSRSCQYKARRLLDIPIQQLQNEIISNNGNFTKVAKSLNVSATAIAKKLKSNGLPFHAMEYRKM